VATPSPDTPDLAASFRHPGVASAYAHRPPYPVEVFEHLRELMGARRRVLDLGAGEGALARPIAEWAELVDAVEISPAMVEVGRTRPGGARSNLRWIVGPAEEAGVEGPYDLVTAGASLHWMRWEATLRLITRVSTREALLVIVDQNCRGGTSHGRRQHDTVERTTPTPVGWSRMARRGYLGRGVPQNWVEATLPRTMYTTCCATLTAWSANRS
jgi:ubiquinone/menaquinone biosynthesis C-methylase UbiE